MPQNLRLEDLPAMDNSDEDSWLYELCDALLYAKNANKDIVSLYL